MNGQVSYPSAQAAAPLTSSQEHPIKPSETPAGSSGLFLAIQGLQGPLLPLPQPLLGPAAPHAATASPLTFELTPLEKALLPILCVYLVISFEGALITISFSPQPHQRTLLG